jgi:hypothetical protein
MNDLICHKCGEKISPDMAYVSVHGDIVLRAPGKNPMIFTCPEQAFNYAQNLTVHDVCWIKMLRESGVQLHELDRGEEHGME